MQKIFIVEDDASLRDEVRVLLERNGYEITVVRDFGQIVDEVRAAAPIWCCWILRCLKPTDRWSAVCCGRKAMFLS